jgi:adenine-specific DNA-methyltransferase
MRLPGQLSIDAGSYSPVARAAAGAGCTPTRQPAHVKAHGIHYTPPDLAEFLATGLRRHAPPKDVLRVIDPACGDGGLLAAVAAQFPRPGAVELTGTEIDARALEAAGERLGAARHPLQLLERDFLESLDSIGSAEGVRGRFDGVISNPPYVRTQALGGARARDVGRRFGLAGRVDLYQAFIRAIAELLAPGGVLALLCSNRFLSIQAGRSVREILRDDFEICELIDLGDTKPFDAAVLPAIVFARRRPTERSQAAFIRAYEERRGTGTRSVPAASLLAAIADGAEGLIEAGGRAVRIERGVLKMGETAADPWTLGEDRVSSWLQRVASRTERTLGELATIRVGIKTTADRVFIRSDWQSLPEDRRPEAALLRPLITHHVAARWRVSRPPAKHVLYPHRAGANGRQQPVELADYPRAARYLESHREQLEGRTYVIAGGRRWYEVWVPQKPGEWAAAKIVFPDISDAPRFFLDRSGAIVNGDCYWITASGLEPEAVSLILAVANSSFSMVFYDLVCGNRLYAGRRRFITQYVKRFPLPRTTASERARVHALVTRLCDADGDDAWATAAAAELNELVWQLFGLTAEELPW